MKWLPGHTNIPGNDLADELANHGVKITTPSDNPPSLARIKRYMRRGVRVQSTRWWYEAPPSNAINNYKLLLDIRPSTKPSPVLALPRLTLHHLLAARSGHGDFADYHERLGHEAAINCSCGRRKHPTHIFYCRKVSPDRRLRLNPARGAIKAALTKNFERFTQLAEDTSFFTKVCPRH